MKKQPNKLKRYRKEQTKHLNDRTDYKRLDAMTDKDIDYSDISETDENFWANAKIMDPGPKQPISLRIDADILNWFKHQEGRYQYLINQVLRHYMNAHRRKHR